MASAQQLPPFLVSKFPVLLPEIDALFLSEADFLPFLSSLLQARGQEDDAANPDDADRPTLANSDASTGASTTADITKGLENVYVKGGDSTARYAAGERDEAGKQEPLSFTDALLQGVTGREETNPSELQNKMYTENSGIAYRSTNEDIVDLFAELEEVVAGPRLKELLDRAWHSDPLSTLKIIFNSRSIHLGKAARQPTYRCLGWLAKYHPLTLVVNLKWLSRPIIEKPKKENQEQKGQDGSEDDDFLMVEETGTGDEFTMHDIKNGLAHGYWKDLLNVLALRVNRQLDVLRDPRLVLNVHQKKSGPTADTKECTDDSSSAARHQNALEALDKDKVYLALHLTVARLFAQQLRADLALLRSKKPGAQRHISPCAKWAPTQKLFHDKHTFVVSSIAEAMYPRSQFDGSLDRETYLRHAREAYRRDVSGLRKSLKVVERDISAKTFGQIEYERVPSIAMQRYAKIFAAKDGNRFNGYLEDVASGKLGISGATLMPSTLIQKLRTISRGSYIGSKRKTAGDTVNQRVIDGQWKTLVQRIKNSGTLDNAIAICDVSGSMYQPVFPDGTAPIDSAIGLSLLIASVCQKPWADAIITFSEHPTAHQVSQGDLTAKYTSLSQADWGGNTDFVAVFLKLILPMARENNLTQDQMVKRVFVFSDMQFDSAQGRTVDSKWSTSYEMIKKNYELYGYETPELIFWNLAGGRAGYGRGTAGDLTAPKPVTADEPGTAIVSGYSQGLLKVFLDHGSFEEPEAEETINMTETDDGDVEVTVSKKRKMNPLITTKKAISHSAYSMLEVMD